MDDIWRAPYGGRPLEGKYKLTNHYGVFFSYLCVEKKLIEKDCTSGTSVSLKMLKIVLMDIFFQSLLGLEKEL